jgi:hypothetical protein
MLNIVNKQRLNITILTKILLNILKIVRRNKKTTGQ